MYLGMSQSEADDDGARGTDEGAKLKKQGWWSGAPATNESGFSALPGGYRVSGGFFNMKGHSTNFSTSTQYHLGGAVTTVD
jgi:uncharacterized protein (TIGR02145 family)